MRVDLALVLLAALAGCSQRESEQFENCRDLQPTRGPENLRQAPYRALKASPGDIAKVKSCFFLSKNHLSLDTISYATTVLKGRSVVHFFTADAAPDLVVAFSPGGKSLLYYQYHGGTPSIPDS